MTTIYNWVPFSATKHCFKSNALQHDHAPSLSWVHAFFSRLFILSATLGFFGVLLWLFLTSIAYTFAFQMNLTLLFCGNHVGFAVMAFVVLLVLFLGQLALGIWYAWRLAVYCSLNGHVLVSTWWASRQQ